MLLAWIIYLIDVLAVDKVGYGAGIWLGPVILAIFLVIFAFWTDGFDNSEKATASEQRGMSIFKSLKGTVTTICVLLMLSGAVTRLLPTKETAYKMLAAYGVTEVVMSETVQKYAGGSLKVLDKAMDEYLGEGWDKVEAENEEK